MPPYFNLKQSTAHRAACIALYRALLAQCSRIYIPDERWRGPINPIKHLIRRRWHKEQHQQSQRGVIALLKQGYQMEELLRHAGDGNQEAIDRVMDKIKNHQDRSDASRAITAQLALQTPKSKDKPRPAPAPYPGAKKMLEERPRSLSALTGRRHVPKLQHTSGGIPILLTKKPQSEFLSRVVRDRIKKSSRLTTVVKEFDLDHQWALYEDRWNRLVGEKSDGGGRWTRVWDAWKNDAAEEFMKMKTENMDMSRRLVELIDKEQALADQEREDRKMEKTRRVGKGQVQERAGKQNENVNTEDSVDAANIR